MSTHTPERELLSVAQVAIELGVSAPTVRRHIRSGELPACQLGVNGSIRVPRAALDAWLWAERNNDASSV